jgi:hypothetical protein
MFVCRIHVTEYLCPVPMDSNTRHTRVFSGPTIADSMVSNCSFKQVSAGLRVVSAGTEID